MAKKSHRGERLGEEIKKVVSDLLLRELRGPGFESGLITVSYVKAADDGGFATIYFTALGAEPEQVIDAFEKAKGFIRGEIGKRLGLRLAPDLRFKPDLAEQYGQHIDTILSGLDIPKDEGPAGREASLSEIAEVLEAYEHIFAFTHDHMDGDTLGSALALVLTLRELGKDAWVFADAEPPRSLAFLPSSVLALPEAAAQIVSGLEAAGEPWLAVAMDYSGTDRIEGRAPFFTGAAERICIDHHVTAVPEGDLYFLDPAAAATAEIVWRLIQEVDWPMNEEIATAIYVGVVTDTGRFQYANTKSETHRIAASLIEAGADFRMAFSEIYQKVAPEKLIVERAMLSALELFADGRGAISGVGQDVLSAVHAGEDETDGMSEKLISIIGMKIGVFLRELPDGHVKVSLRSKDPFDVASLAAEFGGGGHMRAAGFTADTSLEETREILKVRITALLGEKP
ncbi:MAG: 30S ribosome-binding factor RbfA [Clostridiales bacterium]|nr:30S ribosome-binding factor RbfA [Clostridiales bacterium]